MIEAFLLDAAEWSPLCWGVCIGCAVSLIALYVANWRMDQRALDDEVEWITTQLLNDSSGGRDE